MEDKTLAKLSNIRGKKKKTFAFFFFSIYFGFFYMYWGGMASNMGWGIIEDEGWRKGPWTGEEDRLLMEYVRLHGEGRWNSVARFAGKQKNKKAF